MLLWMLCVLSIRRQVLGYNHEASEAKHVAMGLGPAGVGEVPAPLSPFQPWCLRQQCVCSCRNAAASRADVMIIS